MNKIYAKLSDEELVDRYQQGDSAAADYLVEKYKNLVRKKVRSYFLVGADQDDLIQEGMIGLYKAIRDFAADKQTVFMSFASLCIGRQVRTAITTQNRMKNQPLNNAISLDAPVSEEQDEDVTLSQVLPDTVNGNPETILIEQESLEFLTGKLGTELSKMEKEVLELYEEGLSYSEIGEILGKPVKSIDNAIQRIRAKISAFR